VAPRLGEPRAKQLRFGSDDLGHAYNLLSILCKVKQDTE
jgi:hypothetical protein